MVLPFDNLQKHCFMNNYFFFCGFTKKMVAIFHEKSLVSKLSHQQQNKSHCCNSLHKNSFTNSLHKFVFMNETH